MSDTRLTEEGAQTPIFLEDGTLHLSVENGRLLVRGTSARALPLSVMAESANTMTVGFYKPPRRRPNTGGDK